VRLFVAVYPPAAAGADLEAVVGRLRLGAAAAGGANVGLTARPRWHLTLAFLGEVADGRAPEAATALAAGVSRWRAGGGSPPRLRLAGGGRFGRRRFTVLWVGLTGDIEGLRRLAGEVRRGLRRAGLPYDDRKPFRPHLTFARPGERLAAADLAADLASLAEYAGPWWRVDAVALMRSQLGPKPVHEPIAATPLAE
jgi:2'-5' RNA ligase